MHEPSIATPAAEIPLGSESAKATVAAGDDLANDPRVLQILSTEHWSLLSARGLAYNEAFTRGSMFLTFLSMSFVALALLAQAMGFSRDFLVVAAVLLSVAFLIGVTTYARIIDIASDDLRMMHGMNRIRHGYIQIAPLVAPYFTTGTYDDVASVVANYGTKASRSSILANLTYGFSTSLGLVGMIVALVGGAVAAVAILAAGGSGWLTLAVAIVGTLLVLGLLVRWAWVEVPRIQDSLEVRFPAPPADSEPNQPPG